MTRRTHLRDHALVVDSAVGQELDQDHAAAQALHGQGLMVSGCLAVGTAGPTRRPMGSYRRSRIRLRT